MLNIFQMAKDMATVAMECE